MNRRISKTNRSRIKLYRPYIERLEDRCLMAADAITIFAAGVTNEEQMQLLIDNEVVQTWNNIGGNAYAGQFVAYSYQSNTNLGLDRIRIAFTNDLYNPPIDRNLRIDRIEINGVAYQTEAPTVYSTGTWLPQDGIEPGFRLSEYLTNEGYFQYAVNSGSLIQVVAAGWTNNENMELQIDGNTVIGWKNITGDPLQDQWAEYTYRASGTITADRVRVAFTNDLYAPPIDHNLSVDKIIIDGIEYETEAATTFSSGTYVPAQNAVFAGYWGDETLHGAGYFQYLARPFNAGSLGLESSNYSVTEGTATVSLAIVRTSGSDGSVSVAYRTENGTAIAGSDYSSVSGTLTFLQGETRKTISIPITNDTLREAPETFNVVIENPTGGAILLAPRTATVTIRDNDLVLPNYTSFPNANGLKLNGNASITSNTLQLTPQAIDQVGSAYYTTAIPINRDTSFQSQFQFKTTGATTGADGLAFIVQNAAAGASALGAYGQNLGYGGVLSSMAVEFDTFKNGTTDIDGNHISILTNGNTATPVSTKSSGIDFNSGSIVNIWIDYNGDSDQLVVYQATTTVKPSTPFMAVTLDLPSLVGTQAYFGFGAGTGGSINAHQIVNWKLSLDRPPVVTPPPNASLVNEQVFTGLIQPTAMRFLPDGRNVYIAQKDGRVRVARDGVLQTANFIDLRTQVNNVSDRGLLDIAIHPDFPTSPYIYLLYTYDPPETQQNSSHALAGPDKPGNRAGRLMRVTANVATNYTTIVAGSETILLGTNSTWSNFNGFINSTYDINAPQAGKNTNGTYIRDFINSDSESHTVGSLAFAIDGSLYVSIGDGASYNRVDPRATRVQDIDSLSGKILRINPLNGQGYTNNPFYNGDPNSNRSKVYQYGLRNPFRISVNRSTGQLFVGDVGWTQWEEVNSAPAGANYGWPYYEGGSGTNLRTNGYQDLAAAQTFYAGGGAASPAIYALNHAADGINAIVMGAAYTGTAYPAQYRNNVFFNDLGQGIVRAATIDANGAVINMETFATGATYVVQIMQGPDGNLYYVDLDDGLIGRWRFNITQAAPQARAAQTTTVVDVSSVAVSVGAPTTRPVDNKPATSKKNFVFLGIGSANARKLTAAQTAKIIPNVPAPLSPVKSTKSSTLDEATIETLARNGSNQSSSSL
jgi:glucose/arabinose dehydrogenase